MTKHTDMGGNYTNESIKKALYNIKPGDHTMVPYDPNESYEVDIRIKCNSKQIFKGHIRAGQLAALHFAEAVIDSHLRDHSMVTGRGLYSKDV